MANNLPSAVVISILRNTASTMRNMFRNAYFRHQLQMQPKIMLFFRTLTGSLVVLVSGLALIGWISGTSSLTGASPNSLPLLPLIATCLFLLGACHLISLHIPKAAIFLASLTCLLMLLELADRGELLPSFFKRVFDQVFTLPSMSQRISVNGLVSICSLALGHLAANIFRRRARAQSIVFALSFVAIGIGTLALFGYSTGLSSAFRWGNSIPIGPSAASLILLLGLSKATAAWSHMLSLINDFASIVSELRIVLLTLFLALLTMASGIALMAVREAQVNAKKDLVHLFAGSAHERLEGYFPQLIAFADNVRKSALPQHRRGKLESNLSTVSKDYSAEAKRLGIKSIAYVETASMFNILRSASDALEPPEVAVQLRIIDNSIFFLRSIPKDDTALRLELDVDQVRRVLVGINTNLYQDLELILTPINSNLSLYSAESDQGLQIRETATLLPVLPGNSSELFPAHDDSFITIEKKLDSPALKLQVSQRHAVSIFLSRASFFGMWVMLILLALVGSTVLMHLASTLGNRCMSLGSLLSQTVEQLKGEVLQREHDSKIIHSAAKEKEVLLREVHHRVRNNLQIVSSIFNLQLRRTEDVLIKHLLKEAISRLQAISLLHQALYRSQSLSEVSVTNYVKEVVEHALSNFDAADRVKVDVTSDHRPFGIEKVISLGLIITELIMNSAKHAWPTKDDENRMQGSILLDLRHIDDNRARLDYNDDGVGLPNGFNLNEGKSLGMKLVAILTKQLHGELSIRQGLIRGASFTVTFPLKYDQELNGASENSNS